MDEEVVYSLLVLFAKATPTRVRPCLLRLLILPKTAVKVKKAI
jgi:hypothetical protein